MGEYCAMYFAETLGFEEMLEVVNFWGSNVIVSDPNKYQNGNFKEDLKIDETLFGDGVYMQI